MKRQLFRAVCAAALLCTLNVVQMPAARAQSSEISFDAFHAQLAGYGDWVYSDRWGEVWLPGEVPSDFQPYATDGYWADTEDYGWTWVSNYEWGDIPFHYGRWVSDPDDGWLWIPGYVWAPAWVVWRSNAQVIGWMPMPPDRQFLGGEFDTGSGAVSFSINFNDPNGGYGYSQWYGPSYTDDRFAANWVFVGAGHVGDRDFRRYEQPRATYNTVIRNTTNITNYTVVNNTIVNRSVNVSAVQRAGGHPPPPVRANTVLRKPQFITHVDQGRRAQESMRAQTPHGTGVANSAPRPDAKAVSGLSNKVPQRGGRPTTHLLTRDTAQAAPAAGRDAPNGQPPRAEQRPEQRPGQPAAPRPDAKRPDTNRPDVNRPETGRLETGRADTPRPAAAAPPSAAVQRPEQRPGQPAQRPDTNRPEPNRPDTNRADTPRPAAAPPAAQREEQQRQEQQKQEQQKQEQQKQEQQRAQQQRQQPERQPRQEPARQEPARAQPERPQPERQQPERAQPERQQPERAQPERPQPEGKQPEGKQPQRQQQREQPKPPGKEEPKKDAPPA